MFRTFQPLLYLFVAALLSFTALTSQAQPILTNIQIESSTTHTCVLKLDGSLVCWGNTSWGQLHSIPQESFISVSPNGLNSCGIRLDGTIACWGNNDWGQNDAPTGTFTKLSGADNPWACGLRTDQTVSCWGTMSHYHSTEKYIDISVGGLHACGILIDGRLDCFASSITPPPGTFKQIDAGYSHTCAIRSDDILVCWSEWGELSVNTPPAGTYLSIDSNYHNCAVATDYSIKCWGNASEELLNAPPGPFIAVTAGAGYNESCGVRPDNTLECWGPGMISAIPAGGFSAISSGYRHTCGIRSSGQVECWGDSYYGQTSVPQSLYLTVSAGYHNTCAVRTNGTLACWGDQNWGQSTPPSGTFTTVSVGIDYACAVKTNADVVCWGRNNSGQASPPADKMTAISTSSQHACGIRIDETLACWGNQSSGIFAPPSGTFKAVSVGTTHICAVRTNDMEVCWGNNDRGQLNIPPVALTSISAYSFFTCGIKTDQSLVCWGYDDYARSMQPPLGGFTAVSLGGDFGCGIRIRGDVTCWDGEYTYVPIPKPYVSLVALSSSLDEVGTAELKISLSEPSLQKVTMNLSFSGSASFGSDYTTSSDTVAIGFNETSKSVTLTGIGDGLAEGDETIVVDITSVVNGIEVLPEQVTLVLENIPTTATATDTATATSALPDATSTAVATDNLPTSTLTVDPEITFTETPTPTIEATITLSTTPTPSTPTATQTGRVELLANGGFEEVDGEGKPQLGAWQPKNLSGDKIKCNKDGKIVALEGNCAFMFKGAAGENAKLQQLTLLTGTLVEDDLLEFSLQVNTKLPTASKIASVNITYAEADAGVNQNGKDKIKIVLSEPTMNETYQPFTESVAINGTVSNIKVQLTNQNTSGKLFIDAISLMAVSNNALLPLP